ncbi:hypothetical protein KP79_PYT22134 [Mizuhopecten yessoensis]|uniref:C-type lectin domain-containing protein n=1 Tax=Mizuhopecten yessoensis TaxID=6573 RepID=A0A210R4Q4_MIZYE|nr:hypothetical protein KP79_PYT22134 [Mizuhopecten yessoensis]
MSLTATLTSINETQSTTTTEMPPSTSDAPSTASAGVSAIVNEASSLYTTSTEISTTGESITTSMTTSPIITPEEPTTLTSINETQSTTTTEIPPSTSDAPSTASAGVSAIVNEASSLYTTSTEISTTGESITTSMTTSPIITPEEPSQSYTNTPNTVSTELQSTTPPDSCVSPYIYNADLDKCLYLSDKKYNWTEADYYCFSISGRLVVAENGEKQFAIAMLIAADVLECWVGASWDSTYNSFVWSSGIPIKAKSPLSEGCLKINGSGVLSSEGDIGDNWIYDNSYKATKHDMAPPNVLNCYKW